MALAQEKTPHTSAQGGGQSYQDFHSDFRVPCQQRRKLSAKESDHDCPLHGNRGGKAWSFLKEGQFAQHLTRSELQQRLLQQSVRRIDLHFTTHHEEDSLADIAFLKNDLAFLVHPLVQEFVHLKRFPEGELRKDIKFSQ